MSDKKRKLITIDSETDPFLFGRVPKPFSWIAFDGDDYYHWDGDHAGEMIQWLASQHCVVYAHNGGRFDFYFLQDFFEPYGVIRLINNRTASFKIGRAIFRDSFLILPTRLRAYKKDAIDYTLFEASKRNKPAVMRKIIEYQKSDCLYLYELVAGFRKEYGNGLTIAGASINFMGKGGITIPKTTRHHYRAFKPFYQGGRVSVFRPGITSCDLVCYDINSAYPFAMKTERLPWGTAYEIKTGVGPKEKEVALSFVTLEAASTGAFCLEDQKGNLDFPRDKKTRLYRVSGFEYQAARETNTLKNFKIVSTVVFKQSIGFSEYVDHFYGLKKTQDRKSSEYLYSKLFLNSPYGKLGANPEKYRSYWGLPKGGYSIGKDGLIEKPDKFKGCRIEKEIGFKNPQVLISRGLEDYQMRFYNVATAAAITGKVRSMMWKAVCSAKNPVYCDTDGLICESAKVPLGNELGQWKVEFKGNKIGVAGKKLYAFTDGTKWSGWDEDGNAPKGWKVASKGVKLTGPEIMRVAAGETLNFRKEAPSMSLKSGVNFIERDIKSTV